MEAFTKLIQDKKKIGCYTKIDFDFGKATNIMFVNIPSGSLSNEHGTTRVENMSAGYNIKDFTHFYPGTCINTFVAHVRIKLLVNATWSGEQFMKIRYNNDNYRKYIGNQAINNASTKALTQDKKKIECYAKIKFDGSSTSVRFTGALPSKGILSNEQGTTMVALRAQYTTTSFTHFYPNDCADTFTESIPIRFLIDKGIWLDSSLTIHYTSDNYRQYIGNKAGNNASTKALIEDKKKIECYAKIKFDGPPESVRFTDILPNKGILSNEQGTTMVVTDAQYATTSFTHFYPNDCAHAFTESIPIKSLIKNNWVDSSLTIHYSSDNYRKYIDNSYDNTYHWTMFSVGNLLMSLSLSNLYLMYGNKGGYSAAKAANTESAKVLQATQTAQAAVATLKELVLANSVTPDNVNAAVKDKIRDNIDICKISKAALNALKKKQLKDVTQDEIIDAYSDIVNQTTTDILIERKDTILTTAKELIAANIITPENIDTIYKAIAGAADIAQTAFITANEIKALTQGAQGRIEAAVGQAGRTYSSPHIAAKHSIFIISTLVASTSAIFVTHSAVNLISSDSFERKEEQVIYNSKLGSSSSDRAVMTKVGGTTSALVGTALMLVPASHKNNGGFTYDLHTRSKCLSFVLGATLFAGGIFWASSSDVSDVKEQKPIGIELEPGRAMDLISLRESTTYFSYSDDGALSRTSWVGPNDAILFYDFNGTGQADHWSKFVMTEWSEQGATSDFDALLEVFDTNHDMLFDTKDDHYSNFYIWQDANSNGAVEAGELTQLTEAGIVAIDFNTAAAATPAPTSADTAVVEWADGHTTLAHDLTFQYEAESTSIAIA